MDRASVENMKSKDAARAAAAFSRISDVILSLHFMDDTAKYRLMERVATKSYGFDSFHELCFCWLPMDVVDGFTTENEKEIFHFDDILADDLETMRNYRRREEMYPKYFDRFLDSEWKDFEGDLIITDPGYIIKQEDDDRETWEAFEYGENPGALGLTTWLSRDTIYGDWSCTTFNIDNNEPIGQFCADGGMVAVLLLDEILKYNPEYNDHVEHPHTTTLIPNFKGRVRFVVNHVTGEYEDDSDYHSKRDTWEEYEVQVVGEGINKVTGEPINFRTSQTGL